MTEDESVDSCHGASSTRVCVCVCVCVCVYVWNKNWFRLRAAEEGSSTSAYRGHGIGIVSSLKVCRLPVTSPEYAQWRTHREICIVAAMQVIDVRAPSVRENKFPRRWKPGFPMDIHPSGEIVGNWFILFFFFLSFFFFFFFFFFFTGWILY